MNAWGIFARLKDGEDWRLVAIALEEAKAKSMAEMLDYRSETFFYKYEFIPAKRAMDWLLGESE